MKRALVVVAAAAAMLLVPVLPASAAPPYQNCTEAFQDGKANIHRGEPGYAKKLDRDHDGVACEKSTGGSGSGVGSSGGSDESGSASLPRTGGSDAVTYGLGGGLLVALGLPLLAYRRRAVRHTRR